MNGSATDKHFLVICGYLSWRLKGRNNLHYSPSAPQSRFFPHIVGTIVLWWNYVHVNSQTENILDWKLELAFP